MKRERSCRFRVSGSGFRVKHKVPANQMRNPQPATGNPERETRNPKPGTRNPEPGTRNPQPETRNKLFNTSLLIKKIFHLEP